MAIDKGKRDFLTRQILANTFQFINKMADQSAEVGPVVKDKDYFESFETCYPLLSEAGEMLIEEAIRMGIPIEGKSRQEIAKEIFSA